MILFLRQIADMLWAYKEVHIIVASILICLIAKKLLYNGLSSLYMIKITFYIFLAIGYVTATLQLSFNDYTLIIYFKLVSSLLMIVMGMLDNNYKQTIKFATYICIPIILCNWIMAIFGFGYQIWGDSNTYSGLYFFKTDLALAVTISLSLILCSNWIKSYYKTILIIMSIYLIIISNSRAYYVILLLVIAVYYFRHKLKNMIYYVIPISFLSVVLLTALLAFLPKFIGADGLTLDLTTEGFYSSKNTQGRSDIWEAVLERFSNLDVDEQITGAGLDADIQLSSNSMESELAGTTAHNGYIYVLVSTGWIGLIIFIAFLIYAIKINLAILKRPEYKNEQLIPLALLFHIIIYLVSNLSNPNIIFQQESWFFMYFIGCATKIYKSKSPILTTKLLKNFILSTDKEISLLVKK